MKRVAITFFYDEQNIVDEYMFYLIEHVNKFVHRNIFVSNSALTEEAGQRLRSLGCEVIERENVGFDVWAYKAGLECIGYDELRSYDELLMLNHTFYGPIFPFSELFDEMEKRACDFWGITAHKEMIPNPFTNDGILPRHLNSHFIAVRGRLLHSGDFLSYWQKIPMISSYTESVLKHESRFTQHFIDLGYVADVYDDDDAYPSKYPCFINVDQSLERRCPILKRRAFFHESSFHEQNAINLPRALRIMRETSDYDENLIWPNILRSSELRVLGTNAALTRVVADQPERATLPAIQGLRIAVCAHIYYTELLDETLRFAANIPVPFDIIITTSNEAKKKGIEAELVRRGMSEISYVRVVENRGRDMSALFIACRDFFLDDRYDLVLRLHTKKSPQVEGGRGQLFKRHMLENLVGSRGLVNGILEMFVRQPWLGLAVPPMMHISFPTMGNSWFSNKPRALSVAKELGINVKFDASTPVAAYGTMFWFRPSALRKLFHHKWRWDDFNAEPDHVDGGLAHVLERLITYSAQDAGYATMQVLSEEQAALNYAMLEYKLAHLSSFMPWDFPWQAHMLNLWRGANYPIQTLEARNGILERSIQRGASYADMALERVSGRGHRILKALLGQKAPAANADVQQRQDLRYSRNLAVERIMAACCVGTSRFAISGLRRKQEDQKLLLSIRNDVTRVRKFLDSFRNLPRGQKYKSVVDREIVDYLFYSWIEGRELITLFDSKHYASEYMDNTNEFNPLSHYVTVGMKQNLNPHPLFDAKYYLGQVNGRAVENPLADYINLGWKEGLSPHPLFSTRYYLERNADVLRHGVEPLSHFLMYGGVEGRNPHWAFDAKFYLENNPDVQILRVNPLRHFLQTGVYEGRWPNKDFDPIHYKDSFPELLRTGENPLVHYVRECGQ